MTPEQLKASIVQYAMQGKLTEQLSTDSSVAELLDAIRIEKEQLVKEKKIKQEKPLEPIKEEEIPFEIPDNWRWVRWGTLSNSIQYGYNAPALDKGNAKMVRISDIQDNEIIWDKVPYCEVDLSVAESYVLNESDILFARTGGTVGKSCLVKNKPEDAVYVFAGYLIRSNYNIRLNPSYLKIFMDSELYWNQLRRGTTKSAQPNCNGQTLSKMILPLPPLEEQSRIVAKIEELLPFVERYAVSYEKLEQINTKFPEDMKKSILQYAIQGKLVEQRPEEGNAEELYKNILYEKKRLISMGLIKKEKDFAEIDDDEKPFDIPETWKWVRFGELGNYKKGPFGSALTKSMFVEKDETTIKVYEQKNAIQKDYNLGNYYITREYFEKSMKGFEVFPGDIIVSCAGTIGETYILPENIEQGIINQALMRMKVFKPINVDYFLLYFETILKGAAQSQGKGVAIKNIPPFEVLKNYLVALPPLKEQERIVKKVGELMLYCDMLQKK